MRWKDDPVRTTLRPLAALPFALPEIDAAAAAPVVLIDRTAHTAALGHVAASRLERGGLLVGEPFAAAAEPDAVAVILVRCAIASDADTADAISLRMEARVWDGARAVMRAGERVVGWFHSHPGIGAFFSATDRRTQAAFFAQPYSLGWVIDPQRDEEAWFLGRDARALAPAAIVVRDDAVPQAGTSRSGAR
jgi:proteasome lid subunit RPN8/RPN11